MPLYALLDASGQILRRQDFDGAAPLLAAAKGLRWVTDAPPDYDPATHTAPQPVLPVTGDSVTYGDAIPIPVDGTVAGNMMILRRANELRANGDRIGALELEASLVPEWPKLTGA